MRDKDAIQMKLFLSKVKTNMIMKIKFELVILFLKK